MLGRTAIRARRHLSPTSPYIISLAFAAATGVTALRPAPLSLFPNRVCHTPKATMYGGGAGVTVPAAGRATAAIIFLHGLGDTGHGWAAAFPLQGMDYVRTVLPTAEERPVTLNGGMRMPGWFDLTGLDESAADDEPGILASMDRVNRIVDEQVASGIPEHRIVIAGFSQGGAIALTFGLRTEKRIAGVIALSAWLPLRRDYPQHLGGRSRDIEFFMGHGTADTVLSFRFGQTSAGFIQGLERHVSFHQYPGLTHSASPAEIADVQEYLNRVVPRE